MLGKLFKYELLDLFKKTILFFSIVIGLSLLVFLFEKLGEKYAFFMFVNQLLQIGYWLSIAGIVLYSVFYPITRYYKSMLKDEGYLTHTLPVSSAKLLFTKLTSAFILFIASVTVAALSMLLNGIIKFEDIKMAINSFDASNVVVILIFLVYLIVYYYGVVMLFITAITLGHVSSSKKGTMSFVAGVAIYFIQQALGMLAIGVLFIIYPNFIERMALGEINYLIILIVPTITYIILVTSEILLTHYLIKRKLNLE